MAARHTATSPSVAASGRAAPCRAHGGVGADWAPALTWAAWVCPLAVLYSIMTILVGRPGSQESAHPVVPALVIALAFGFTLAAMLVPLLSEFDVALGRTTGGGE